jgi:hypothetical protein
MASGGSSSGSSQSSTDPWKGQQKYLSDIYQRARGLSNEPMEYYGSSTVGPEGARTTDYRNMVADRVEGGSSLLNAAQDQTEGVIRGDYLNANPYRDEAFDAGAEAITRNYKRSMIPGIDSRYAGSGRFGSYAHRGSGREGQRVLSNELGNLADQFYFQDYGRERGFQEEATRAAPGMAAADFDEMAQLGAVGQQEDRYSQAQLDDLVRRFDFGQREPWERLSMYSQALGTSPVMSSQSSAQNESFNLGIMSCWAAAAHFGWYTPAWWDAAIWINVLWPARSRAGAAFLRWYRSNGQVLADRILGDQVVRVATRPFFEWARRAGRRECGPWS